MKDGENRTFILNPNIFKDHLKHKRNMFDIELRNDNLEINNSLMELNPSITQIETQSTHVFPTLDKIFSQTKFFDKSHKNEFKNHTGSIFPRGCEKTIVFDNTEYFGNVIVYFRDENTQILCEAKQIIFKKAGNLYSIQGTRDETKLLDPDTNISLRKPIFEDSRVIRKQESIIKMDNQENMTLPLEEGTTYYICKYGAIITTVIGGVLLEMITTNPNVDVDVGTDENNRYSCPVKDHNDLPDNYFKRS